MNFMQRYEMFYIHTTNDNSRRRGLRRNRTETTLKTQDNLSQ